MISLIVKIIPFIEKFKKKDKKTYSLKRISLISIAVKGFKIFYVLLKISYI